MSILGVAVDPATVIVAVDPGKVLNRVWVSNGSGLLDDPISLPVSREGIDHLERLLTAHAAPGPLVAIEATGSLHRSWASELERLHSGAVRLFAPSETKAARVQLYMLSAIRARLCAEQHCDEVPGRYVYATATNDYAVAVWNDGNS